MQQSTHLWSLMLATLVLVLVYTTEAKERNNKPFKVVCYYQPEYPPEQISLTLCTHINFAFALLKNGTVQLDNPTRDDGPSGRIHRTIALRKSNPHLTVMISLGGWCEGSTKYSEMARNASTRKVFIDSALAFLARYDFDGLDLDWEYPGFSGNGCDDRTDGRAEDKQDYITLLTEMRAAFKPHNYLLTAAIAAGRTEFERAYDIHAVAAQLDFLNLMAYDLHGAWDVTTEHHAPLFINPKETKRNQELTVQYAVEYFLRNGTDPAKLVLGIPIYGHVYHLANVANYGVGVAVNGTGREQRAYNKLCVEFKEPGWRFFFDEVAQVPYAVKGDQWISYENVISLTRKVEYIREKKLGGSMVWSVDIDDTKGVCGLGTFPLMKPQMWLLNRVDPVDTFAPVPHA